MNRELLKSKRPAVSVAGAVAASLALAVAISGCSVQGGSPTRTGIAATPGETTPGVTPVGSPTEVATGLESPWSMLRLASGSTLVSERDTGRIRELTAAGDLRDVGTIDGVVHQGEGGLLGLAVQPDDEGSLFAYLTAASDNRIVKVELSGSAGSYTLGSESVILDGLAKAANHDGGRIAFGPDGMLYATVGDAGDTSRAQDLHSLNGKILRIAPDGGVPFDNPFEGSLVYSYGHRNPQGIAWDDTGQLYAAEFGQNEWDEFNRIVPGGNYGWPEVEGIEKNPDFVDPLYQWATDVASPSGLTWVDGTFFLAALKGERLWAITVTGDSADATSWFAGEHGRLRDVAPGPDGSLWVLTNNTDGRGSPRAGDDRILQWRLSGPVEG